jgi:antitoxin component YwqK of YwqJK toxin-antitoxin module
MHSQNPVNNLFKGESDGDYTDYYSNGAIKNKLKIKNGSIDGDRVCLYKNGSLLTLEQFDNGVYNGTNYMLNKKHDTIYIERYRHDTLLFTKNFYYNFFGNPKRNSTVWYILDSSTTNNPFLNTKYKRNGLTKDIDITQEKNNNYRIDIYFYMSGNVKKYIEGKKLSYNGKYIEYYKNGHIKTEASYLENLCNGTLYRYYASGNLKIKANYKDNKLDGEYSKFNRKGELIKDLKYKNGILQK